MLLVIVDDDEDTDLTSHAVHNWSITFSSPSYACSAHLPRQLNTGTLKSDDGLVHLVAVSMPWSGCMRDVAHRPKKFASSIWPSTVMNKPSPSDARTTDSLTPAPSPCSSPPRTECTDQALQRRHPTPHRVQDADGSS